MSLLRKEITPTRTRYYLFGFRVLSLHMHNDIDINLELHDIYNDEFYKQQAEGSYKSAKKILPYVHSLLNNKSVLDVGCGVGTWLKAWSELGVDIHGLDSNLIKEDSLSVPREKITIVDLASGTADCDVAKVDLVQSLEVAEHLDESCADNFVDLLCSKSDTVLFSAAIPFQGGTHHVNLKPVEYWNQKFKDRGYVCFDLFREKFWSDADIEWWYRQNMVLFAKGKSKDNLIAQGFTPVETANTYYHPDLVKLFIPHAD